MTDYQRLMDNIRGFLASSNQVRTDEVVECGTEYARACKEANDRLRQCNEYLQKGLRTEAIFAAEEQPNLLDLVAALDLAELEDWRQLCFRYEMPDPPMLAMESAAALNEAYADAEPMRPLLARNRLLALAAAPLKLRLGTMRQVAEGDPSAPFWDDDIRVFERARLEEIRSEIPRLAHASNAVAAQLLCEELDSPAWRSPVSADLRRRAHDLAGRLRSADGEAALRKLLPALEEAYSAMSFGECLPLLRQWDEIVGDSQVTVPEQLKETIDPIIAWGAQQQAALDQQAVFEDACNRLQQVLDVDAPDAELERAYLTVARIPLGTPPELEQRYEARRLARASARKNKQRLIFAAIVAGFLLLGGVVTLLVFQGMQNREIADTQAALHNGLADVDAGNTDRPDAMMKQMLALHPRVANSPAVVKAVADLHSAIDAERHRAAGFRRHLGAVLADGIDHANLKEIQLAEPLAKLGAERGQLAAVKSQIAEYQTGQQQERDAKFTADGAALAHSIDEILTPDLLKSNPAEYQKQFAALDAQIMKLRWRTGISPGLSQAEVSSATALLKQKQGAMDGAALEGSMIAQLGDSSSVADQASVLKRYLDKFPASLRAVDFRQALDQSTPAQAIEAWTTLARGWGKVVPSRYEDVARRITAISEYLKAWPSSPLAGPVGDLLTYLQIGQQAAAPDGPWKKAFRAILDNPLVHDLQMVQTASGKRYYTLGKINFKASMLNETVVAQEFDAVTSTDVSKRSRITAKESDLLQSDKPVNSPQSAFAAKAAPEIDAMNFGDWDQMGPTMIAMLVSSKDMNIVLKSVLLQNALQAGQPTFDWVGNNACKSVFDGLGKQDLDNIEWLDPDNLPPEAKSDALKALVEQLPPMQHLGQAIVNKRNATLAALPTRLTARGVVLRGTKGALLTRKPATESAAFVIGSEGKLVKIATSSDGTAWVIDSAAASQVPEGALVFVGPLAR